MFFASLLLLALASSSLAQCPDSSWRLSSVNPNKCYKVFANQKAIWFEAEAACGKAASGAHLTSIVSAYELFSLNAIIHDTADINRCDQLWIGGNDFDTTGRFVWSDNQAFNYNHWGAGQPDLSNQCVSSGARTNGDWKTEPCGTENCFICDYFINGGR